MPKRKRRTRKSTRKGRRRRRRRTPLYRMGAPAGVQTTRMVTQRYCQYVELTATTLDPFPRWFFRANSVYDPDFTGTGQQPMGYDQLAQQYNRYIVVGAKVNIFVACESAGNGDNYMVGCFLDDNAILPYADWRGVVEARRGSNRLLSHQRNSTWLNCKFGAKKFFNVTNVKDNWSDIGAVTGGNPPNEAFFCLWFNNLELGAVGGTTKFRVVIDYIVVYSEPKELARS